MTGIEQPAAAKWSGSVKQSGVTVQNSRKVLESSPTQTVPLVGTVYRTVGMKDLHGRQTVMRHVVRMRSVVKKRVKCGVRQGSQTAECGSMVGAAETKAGRESVNSIRSRCSAMFFVRLIGIQETKTHDLILKLNILLHSQIPHKKWRGISPHRSKSL